MWSEKQGLFYKEKKQSLLIISKDDIIYVIHTLCNRKKILSLFTRVFFLPAQIVGMHILQPDALLLNTHSVPRSTKHN